MAQQHRSTPTGPRLSWDSITAFVLGAVAASVITALGVHEAGLSSLVAS